MKVNNKNGYANKDFFNILLKLFFRLDFCVTSSINGSLLLRERPKKWTVNTFKSEVLEQKGKERKKRNNQHCFFHAIEMFLNYLSQSYLFIFLTRDNVKRFMLVFDRL